MTGATGFIGSHLAEELLRKGYGVSCLVRNTSSLKWLEGLDVSLVAGDCREKASLVKATEGVDVIFHLAGLTKAPRDEDFYSCNAAGTENLLAAARLNPGLKRFLYLSSLAAVGPSLNGIPVTEESEPHPVSSYGKSKLMGEGIVLKYKDSMPVTVIRPPAVYGPRDRDFHVLYRMIKRGIVLNWGRCVYSLLYVDDLVRALIRAATTPEAEDGVFFVADDALYSNEDIVQAISEAMGARPLTLRVPRMIVPLVAGLSGRLGRKAAILKDRAKELGHANWTCNPSKAHQVLGFIPKVKLTEGVKWTANWYRIHQWL